MIKNVVYTLLQDVEVAKDINVPKGTDIEIVNDIVYIGGHPLPQAFQALFFNFVRNNQNLLKNTTRDW